MGIMKCNSIKLLTNILFILLPIASFSDTIDTWSVYQDDSCLIRANENYFEEGKEVIYVGQSDVVNTYSVSYNRDVGYDTKCKLHFSCNGAEFYAIYTDLISNHLPIDFTLSTVLDKNPGFSKGDTLEIYYSEENDFFSSDKHYIGALVAKENIVTPKEAFPDRLLIIFLTLFLVVGILFFIIRKKIIGRKGLFL